MAAQLGAGGGHSGEPGAGAMTRVWVCPLTAVPCLHSKLHCMRNYIHMNLFASFILKGVSVLVIDALLKTHYSDKIDDYNVHMWLSDEVCSGAGEVWGAWGCHSSPDLCPQAAAGCRAATVFMQYGIVANYCWLLVEGIYLHNLLVVAVFSERSYFTLYLCIGWGECRWTGSPSLTPFPDVPHLVPLTCLPSRSSCAVPHPLGCRKVPL